MPEFWVPPTDPDTLLTITGLGGFQYQARGLHQTMEVISAANQCERTINGVLVDVSNPQFRKYQSKITCTDITAPPLDNLFPGMTVTVQFAGELAYPTGNAGAPARNAVFGSTRTPDGGNYTFYRPVLTMLVRNLNYSFDEWGSDYGWELDLEEV